MQFVGSRPGSPIMAKPIPTRSLSQELDLEPTIGTNGQTPNIVAALEEKANGM